MNAIIKEITSPQEKEGRNHFKVGDGVRVHIRIKEGEKERIQIFSGIVISRKGPGLQETFMVRRVHNGYGVEKIFPVHSPSIEKIEVDRESIPMRSKLYYMRKRIGKKATEIKKKRLV